MQYGTEKVILVFLTLTAIMSILCGFIVTLFFLYRKKQLAFIHNLDELRSEYEKSILTVQLEIQENTLLNITQEIHDNIGLSLTLAKLNLNSIDSKDFIKTQSFVINSENLISKAIGDLNDLSKSFNAEVILNQGFLGSIQHEIERINKHLKLKFNYEIEGEIYGFDSKFEILLFRILQESINNVIKHASASAIDIKIQYLTNLLTLSIKDDGVGFDSHNHLRKSKSGAGLQNIRKRTALMNGNLDIQSAINQGTSLTISIPTNN